MVGTRSQMYTVHFDYCDSVGVLGWLGNSWVSYTVLTMPAAGIVEHHSSEITWHGILHI